MPARTFPRTSSAKITHATPPRAKVMPMNRPAHRLPVSSICLPEGPGAHNRGERTVRRKGPGRWFKTDQGPLSRHHGRDEGRYHRGAGKASDGIPDWRPWSRIPEDSESRPQAVALVELLASIVLLAGGILARLLIR